MKEAKAYSNYENEKIELEKIINDKKSDSEMKELAELLLDKETINFEDIKNLLDIELEDKIERIKN